MADSKVSSLTTIGGAAVDVDSDKIYIVDTSAGSSGSKAISPKELIANTACIAQSGSGAVSRTVAAKLQESVSVLDFIPVASHAGILAGTNTDDLTAYFVLALATGKRVFVPAGTYYVNVTQLASNAYLYGEGEATVIRAYTTTSSTLKCTSADASTFITGVVIRDLKLYGTVVADGFHASPALIDFTGVKRCRIEGVYFEGFRLDGIYLGGNNGVSEFHNLDVVIKNCVFDGVNNGGRNGISVIDVDGIEIEGCTFRNCATTNQPGSIDFEPNQSFSVIKNVRVVNNRFYNTDGNRGHVVIATQNASVDNVENILISGNHFENPNVDNAAIVINLVASAPTNQHNIVIANNTSYMASGNFIWKRSGYTVGVTVTGNTIRGLRGIFITQQSSLHDDKYWVISNNQFYITGAGSRGIIVDTNAYYFTIANNVFASATVHHIRFTSAGSTVTQYISISGNDFIGSPSGGAISHESTTKNETTNRCIGNRFDATQNFKAYTRNNVGFATETSGTASIASGATTAVVNHGLAVTPTAADISIVFAEQGTNDYGRWSIGTLTSTQFTLTVAADPGASNLDFGWQATVVRAIA